ncbi:hypothetical protein CABS01_07726 [Colletotrichum abscissum]|uniref:uncharacterized protein n=1 Tax=Colletotrichum abscissum TaxID=1671311 RepID=UPI0027D54F25|nr:uncharacterized protein CABS01_07726 [Colletotrichum abscissum]KAI3546373.1 hypothetical protein CSPX01_04452 [Colletotrichum filicis]KAK1510054.1 hypothetical protein CABS01_07726 [Colletotrichum abscissum]
MRFLATLLAVAGLAIGTPANLVERSAPPRVKNIDFKEMRLRMHLKHPTHLISQSFDLNDVKGMLVSRAGTADTIYIRNFNTFIPMTSFRNGPTSDGETTAENHCFMWDEWELRDVKSYWSSYTAASKMQHVGLVGDPETVAIPWEEKVSVKRRISLTPDWRPIKSVLSIALGMNTTDEWTHGGTFQCTTAPNKRIRLWFQKYVGSAYAFKKICRSCGGERPVCEQTWTPQGQIIIPSDGSDPDLNYNMHCSSD